LNLDLSGIDWVIVGGEGMGQVAGELELCEVVTVCDHLAFFGDV
jgi:hypothetical protein